MPKYLVEASLTAEGVRGVQKEGGTSRVKAVTAAIKGLGGKLECYYFAFGERDVFLIADFPDNASAASFAMAVGSSGAVRAKTTVLLTPAEVDRAVKRKVGYRPPGGK